MELRGLFYVVVVFNGVVGYVILFLEFIKWMVVMGIVMIVVVLDKYILEFEILFGLWDLIC